jgi:hypothetical protein
MRRSVAAAVVAASFCALAACAQPYGRPATPGVTGVPGVTARPSVSGGSSYYLLIHCGVRFATFDGEYWEALPPIPSIPGYVTDPKTGVSTSRYEIAGRMVRLSSTEAQFTTTDPPAGLVVTFSRTTASPGPCA